MENSTVEPSNQNSMKRTVVLVSLILFVGLGGLLLAMKKSQNNMSKTDQTTAVNTPVPTAVPLLGKVNITVSPSSIKVGTPVKATVTADSEGKDIAGFDILISYDANFVTVANIAPVNKDFQITSFTKKLGQISMTGTKSSSKNAPTILNNADLVTVTFNPIKKGTTKIELKKSINQEVSKFIDSEYKQFTPNLSLVQLEIL